MCWNLHFILHRSKACDHRFLKQLRHRVCLHCGVLWQPAGFSKEVWCVQVPAHLSVSEWHEVSCEACSVPFWLVVSSPQAHPDWLVCPHRLIPQLEIEWHHQWHHKPGQAGDRMTSPMTSQMGQAGDRMTSPMTSQDIVWHQWQSFSPVYLCDAVRHPAWLPVSCVSPCGTNI